MNSSYSNNEQCTIMAKQFLPNVSATAFQTEYCCDHVTIDGQQYSGTIGPRDVCYGVCVSMCVTVFLLYSVAWGI